MASLISIVIIIIIGIIGLIIGTMLYRDPESHQYPIIDCITYIFLIGGTFIFGVGIVLFCYEYNNNK